MSRNFNIPFYTRICVCVLFWGKENRYICWLCYHLYYTNIYSMEVKLMRYSENKFDRKLNNPIQFLLFLIYLFVTSPFRLLSEIIKKLVFCIFVSSIQYAEYIVNRLYALHICIYLYILIYISIYSHILHKYTKLWINIHI